MASDGEHNECIFCKILAGQAPAKILYQDDLVTVFPDRLPRAKVHLLVVPNQHIASLNEVSEQDAALLSRLLLICRKMAEDHGLAQNGYRLVANTGPDSGQVVHHLHFHVLGGQRLLPVFFR
jgi:histidine triad (HIT) family protein